MNFIHSLQSEWLKKKRSLASWLVWLGAFFTPSIVLLSRLKNAPKLTAQYQANDFWIKLWNQSWESMAVFLMPFGLILAVALITQIEYKNNAWKQLHSTPQLYLTIFVAKFVVILIMLVEAIVLFNVGIYLSGVIPALIFNNLPYPAGPIPYLYFLKGNIHFLLDCAPILALQYLISLRFRNFLVPIGTGFALWFLGIGMLSWEYSYLFPYIHSTIDFLISSGQFHHKVPPINIPLLAVIYFAVFTVAGYFFYVTRDDKG